MMKIKRREFIGNTAKIGVAAHQSIETGPKIKISDLVTFPENKK